MSRNRLTTFSIQSRLIVDFGFIMTDKDLVTNEGIKVSLTTKNVFSEYNDLPEGYNDDGFIIYNNTPLDIIDCEYLDDPEGYKGDKRFFIVVYNKVKSIHLYEKSVEEFAVVEEFKIEDYLIDNLPCLASKDIDHLSTNHQWDNNHLIYFSNYIDWELYSKSKRVSKENLDMFSDKLMLKFCLNSPFLTLSDIEPYLNKGSWDNISSRTDITTDFMLEYKKDLNWSILSPLIDLTSFDLSKKNPLFGYLNWDGISANKTLTHKDIASNLDLINWGVLSESSITDTEIITNYHDNLDFDKIKKNEKISKSDKEYYYDLIDWESMVMSGKISSSTATEFKDRLNGIEENFLGSIR